MLAVAWGLAALGVVAVVPALHLPRQLVAALYVALGWAALVALPQVVALLGAARLLLPIVAGALYTAGALVYACRGPPLWPRVFGYHELLHLVVVVASTLVFLFMLQDVVPFVRRYATDRPSARAGRRTTPLSSGQKTPLGFGRGLF